MRSVPELLTQILLSCYGKRSFTAKEPNYVVWGGGNCSTATESGKSFYIEMVLPNGESD